jgi:beta-barrel assembly-enhancing protease
MKKSFLFPTLLVAGLGLVVAIVQSERGVKADPSFAPAFQLAGKIPGNLDRAVMRTLPIDSVDEAALGDDFANRQSVDPADQLTVDYLNELVRDLSRGSQKKFKYRVFLERTSVPNAMALPGGVLFVTTGLLATMQNEAQLASVLGHEIGHVELSHCMSTVKFQLLTRKAEMNLGQIGDFAYQLLTRHSYSKTNEDEADQYGYGLLVGSTYDPSAMGQSFDLLAKYSPETQTAPNPFRDYFLSHPPLKNREAKFSALAKSWWSANQGARRYRGAVNLKTLTPFRKLESPTEWSTSF